MSAKWRGGLLNCTKGKKKKNKTEKWSKKISTLTSFLIASLSFAKKLAMLSLI